MNKYWVDFEGYCIVEANSAKEAREKFLEQGVDCAINEPAYEVSGTEKVEE